MDRPATHRKNNHIRQQEAIERQTKRNERTPIQQLAELDANLGVGVGAVKERARLLALITK